MLVAHAIMVIGFVIPYVTVASAKARKGYDNRDPRDQSLYEGWRKRAYAAHNNSLEAFPFFAAAVLLATIENANATFVNIAAIVWLAARLVHLWAYVTDRPNTRGIIWFVGTFAVLAIFGAALTA